MPQPTIKDVAKLAGVSISTVSRVMNKSKPVSPEAEKKVVDAINKLGFKPNELARSLVMKKSNSIGILVKDIGIEYMAQMIRGAEEIGRIYNYDILLSSTYGEAEQEQKAVDFLYRKQVEGIIIIAENIEADTILQIREYKLPYILLDHFYKSNDFYTVTIDYREAMKKLTNKLLELGNKEIVYIKEDHNNDISQYKLQGYLDGMAEAGLDTHVLTASEDSADASYQAIADYEKKKDIKDLSAIITESDTLALGVINYCFDNNISIPDELQVAGFGGSHLGDIIRPRLTTVIEPYYDIGAIAMRKLTKILEDDEVMDGTIFLPTQLAERETTKDVDR